ncbi:permease-like cell division protein FtsX [Salinibius halmophilus]|uniref:permease-like cell division protein FtsX n=1 Tax=Salinibius halmophilus TaxID=1853216 RepID=UPI000E67584E|nr:permease-like cell division protein FtsX [Salinibius halmophilus]
MTRNQSVAVGANERLAGWWRHHQFLFAQTPRDLIRKPIASMLTWLVIAIALTLPTLFYVGIKGLTGLTDGWHAGAQMSLFLQTDVSDERALALSEELLARPEIASARYIAPDQGLAEFRQQSGLEALLDNLDSNPLPGVIELTPQRDQLDFGEGLQMTFSALPEVARVQLDLAWLERLGEMLVFAQKLVWLLSALLSLAVLLVVGNTIRMSIEQRRDEILVVKVVGGTDAFVRRPFLHMGAWYGLIGGIFACVMVQICLAVLAPSLASIAQSYGVTLTALSLSIGESLFIIFASIVVSLVGSRLAVARHIRDIEPS